MLGLVVAKVFLSWMILNTNDSLYFVAQQPKISHVHCARSLTLDCFVDNTNHHCVVDANGNGRLGMPHFDKG